jgi:biotin transport system substrate-specific component
MPVGTQSGSLVTVTTSESALAPAVRAGAVALAVAVTAAAAQVAVPLPFTPVPLVFTPLAVLLAGSVLGSRLGFLSQVIYVAAGVAGLPVFAPAPNLLPGAAHLLGPTGGYLMAYPLAAWVAGRLAERGWDRRYWTAAAAMLLGLGVIYVGGVSWLAAMFTHSLDGALTLGFRWFVALDVLKVLAGAMVLPQAWRFVRGTPASGTR